MRLNKKMTVLTAALALGLMTGCGASASSSTASSAASSEAVSSVASSEAASEENSAVNTVDPIEIDESVDNLLNGDSSYKVHASLTDVGDSGVTLEVYSYDAYEQDDINNLKVGDVIRTHDGMTNELTDMTIETLEHNENDDVVINGGIEEGGVELWTDRGVYRTVSMDGYPVYYEVGTVTLPLADDVTIEDSSAESTASAIITTGAADAEAYIASDDNWTVYNTTFFIQNGQVFDIQRVWVP